MVAGLLAPHGWVQCDGQHPVAFTGLDFGREHPHIPVPDLLVANTTHHFIYMSVRFALFLLSSCLCFEFMINNNEMRTFTWPITPSQQLVIEAEFLSPGSHYYDFKIMAGEIKLHEERIYGRKKVRMTVPHPGQHTEVEYYVVIIKCQAEHPGSPDWNLVSLQMHANFDHIIKHNQQFATGDQGKLQNIIDLTRELNQLAEQHKKVQEEKRMKEDRADQIVQKLHSEIVFITMVEMAIIVFTIVMELLCLRGLLKSSNAI